MVYRTPIELITLYWEEVWNNQNFELVREICGDPMIRHDIGTVTILSHDQQIARLQKHAQWHAHFVHRVLVANDEYASSVWNVTSKVDDQIMLCGTETMRAREGRLIETWNSPLSKGRWGEVGDPEIPDDSEREADIR